MLVALSVPECDEDLLNNSLSRSEIRLEAWAVDRSQNNATEPTKDLVHTVTLSAQQEPVVLVRQSEDVAEDNRLILVWEVQLALTRPRVRMVDPSISIYSVLTVSSPDDAKHNSEVLLQPFQPLESNVLESLRHVPQYVNSEAYLAVSRLDRVLPSQPKPKKHFRLEHMSPRYRIVPATVAKLTYSRVNMASSIPKIIASLNLEIIPFVELRANIQALTVTIASGYIEDLTPDLVPLDCRSRDLITFLYRLSQSSISAGASNSTPASHLPNFDVLSIQLRLQIGMSDTCHPMIHMDFTTNIDFFQALNASYGGPSQPIQRHNRPASLPLGNGGSQSQPNLSTTLQPVQPMANLGSYSGVTISFTSPDQPVRVGKPFIWRVLINNRSARSVKLAIYPLPHVPRAPSHGSAGKRHAARTSIASYRSVDGRRLREDETTTEVAQAVIDENVVYAMQHSHTAPTETDIVSLTAEVRVGALAAGQCHESEIELVAMKAGTLKVDAMRIVDLVREAEEGIGSAGVMVDIRDLPDVVAVV